MSGFLCGMDPAVVAPIAVIVAVADHVIFRRKSRWLLMTDVSQLLQIAVEDNVAWCSRICSAHGSNETRRSEAWANFGISPPFYPNIITRQKGVQKEVDDLTRKVREANKSTKWGIKDSFADLTLADQGFERLLVGRWYGGSLSKGTPTGWKAVASSGELRSWEKAWGSCDDTIFSNTLLEDYRITFWFKGELSGIEAGFISTTPDFHLGYQIGSPAKTAHSRKWEYCRPRDRCHKDYRLCAGRRTILPLSIRG
ncbi:hypothetical protein [Rhizobium ruizarguesonis]|uniref:hypothetical protein n=1 Tax=Rhizobium ruizarguesonis TaxID=2081791 RepID=UPI003713C1FC